MARTKKKAWSYSTGERGRNRVRVYEHRPGIIYIEFYVDGTRKRDSLKHGDRTKAKTQADEAAARLAKADAVRSLGPTVLSIGTLFEKYLGEVTGQKAPTTQKHDRAAAKRFTKSLGGGTQAHTLHRGHWDRFIRERSQGKHTGRSVGPRTVARDLKWLGAVLNWACATGDGSGGFLLDRNPLRGLRPPREESPKRPTITPERFEKMISVSERVGWRFSVALVLANETGHRIGAIRQLVWADIDFDAGSVRWRKMNDKIGLEHVTPLTRPALGALEKARRHNPGVGDAWVFPAPRDSRKPGSRDLMTALWKRAEKLAGLSAVPWLGWHSLRRRFATEYKDIPLRELCDLGGWKDPDTVVRCYQHSEEEDLRRAIERRRKSI
jgi:integrase